MPLDAAPPHLDLEAVAAAEPDALLLDLDGTLLVDGKGVAGAAALVERFRGRCAVVTNNSTDTPCSLARRLAAAGIPLPAERIFTAGMLLVEEVVRRTVAAPAFALLAPVLRAEAEARGAVLADEAALVAVGRDAGFGYAELARAANLVRGGAALIASNLDGHHPADAGRIVPETGALVAAILAAAGSTSVTVLGKPAPTLGWQALRALGAEPGAAVVIGDNPATDGALARAIGARFVPVLPRDGDQ